MLIPIHGVKLCAHYYTCSEALSSFRYMVLRFALIVIHGVKFYSQCFTRSELYAHCYTRSEATCSLQYMK